MADKSDFTDPSKRILPITALAPMGSQQIRDLSPSYWFGPLQPVRTSAPSTYRPRQYAYPPGANIIWQPKGEDPISYEVLRGLADSWDLLRIIITTQLDRICSCEWEIRAKQEAGESNEDRKKRNLEDSDVQSLLAFFKKPDGFHPWKTWLRMWMEDCIVLDAVALYLARDTKGKVATIHPLDGATINRLLTDQGITPPPPSAAYQQVVYGTPCWDFTTDDMLFAMRNERTNRRYGCSAVEQVIRTVCFGIRRQSWQISEYSEGTVPEALVFLPSDLPIDRVKEVQDWFDSMLSGELGQRRRVRFLPGYGTGNEAKPNIIFPKEPLLKDELDVWLAQIACMCIGISAQPFLKMMNRASAQQSQETSEEEGLKPYTVFIQDVLNDLIQEKMGFPDHEFVWSERRSMDPLKQAQTDAILVGKVYTINELREARGDDPRSEPEADKLGMFTPTGFIPLGETASPQGTGPTAGGEGGAKPGPGSPGEPPDKPAPKKPGGDSGPDNEEPPAKKPKQDKSAKKMEDEGEFQKAAGAEDPEVEAELQKYDADPVGYLTEQESILKLCKDNPYHDPATGQFTTGDGSTAPNPLGFDAFAAGRPASAPETPQHAKERQEAFRVANQRRLKGPQSAQGLVGRQRDLNFAATQPKPVFPNKPLGTYDYRAPDLMPGYHHPDLMPKPSTASEPEARTHWTGAGHMAASEHTYDDALRGQTPPLETWERSGPHAERYAQQRAQAADASPIVETDRDGIHRLGNAHLGVAPSAASPAQAQQQQAQDARPVGDRKHPTAVRQAGQQAREQARAAGAGATTANREAVRARVKEMKRLGIPWHNPGAAAGEPNAVSVPAAQVAANSELSPIEKTLKTAKVQSIKDKPGNHVNEVASVTLVGGQQAIWKPQNEDEHTTGSSGHGRGNMTKGYDTEREQAAWEVAKRAGYQDIAIPCAIRDDIKGQHGVLMQRMGGHPARDVGGDRYDDEGVHPGRDAARIAVFDYAIGNEDRHAGNWRVEDNGHLIMQDHGLSFPDKGDYGKREDGRRVWGNRLICNHVAANPPSDPPAKVAAPLIQNRKEIVAAVKTVGLPPGSAEGLDKRIGRLAKMTKVSDWDKFQGVGRSGWG